MELMWYINALVTYRMIRANFFKFLDNSSFKISLLAVSRAYPASYPVSTAGPFHGGKTVRA
jgi:hypothetical protein